MNSESTDRSAEGSPQASAELGKPPQPLPLLNVPESFVSLGKSRRGGRRLRQEVSEKAPDGGFLVGLELHHKTGFSRRPECRGVRAIYQIEDRYQYGALFGLESPNKKRLLAGAGEVVGGCEFDFFGGVIKSARLIFYPFDGQTIDKEGRRLSEDFGDRFGHSDVELDLAQPAVGLSIQVEDDRADFGPMEEDEGFDEEDLDDLVRIEGLTLAFANVELAKLQSSESEPLPVLPKAAHSREHELLLSSRNSGTVRYYDSAAPEGGCLVGFRKYLSRMGNGFGAHLVPIYQLGTKTVLGPEPEDAPSEVEMIRAKPGYAVCGFLFHGNQLARVAFAAMTENGRLDMKDTYLTKGRSDDGAKSHTWQSKGEPIRGVKYSYAGSIDAIAFVTGASSPPTKRSPPILSRSGEPLNASPYKRIWTSDRGKKVEAWLVRYSERGVTIQREGGKSFRLPLEKYSSEDQDYLQSLERVPARVSPRKSR